MRAFYDSIVPKNVNNLLRKFGHPVERSVVDTLDTPSGAKGQGFTLFSLSPEVRQEIMKGQPLFANGGRPGATAGAAVNASGGDDQQAVQFDTGLVDILRKYGLLGTLGAAAMFGQPSKPDWTSALSPGDA